MSASALRDLTRRALQDWPGDFATQVVRVLELQTLASGVVEANDVTHLMAEAPAGPRPEETQRTGF